MRDQQVLSKGPVAVQPLRFAVEASLLGDLPDVIKRIFVARFCPDSFTRIEFHGQIGGLNPD